jgi:polysaccharide deacetylase family protein (PEP-CTERM system associated)
VTGSAGHPAGSRHDEGARPGTPRVVMSVDVEDWFQVENLRGVISRESWDDRERRVVANTERILSVLARTETTATFFCLGWIAEREPDLIRAIAAAGHEIASHGYAHRLIYEQDISEFREDVIHAREILSEISGQEIVGYRAPSFSITEDALRVLEETGHRYDSSWFPAAGHDRYGRLELPIPAEYAARGVVPPVIRLGSFREIPITTRRLGSRLLPWGGGGWFRLFPEGLFRRGFIKATAAAGGGIFYLHPWEVDPGQPRMEGIRRSYAFRHYVNLAKTEGRLERLCRAVPFTSAARMLAGFPGE